MTDERMVLDLTGDIFDPQTYYQRGVHMPKNILCVVSPRGIDTSRGIGVSIARHAPSMVTADKALAYGTRRGNVLITETEGIAGLDHGDTHPNLILIYADIDSYADDVDSGLDLLELNGFFSDLDPVAHPMLGAGRAGLSDEARQDVDAVLNYWFSEQVRYQVSLPGTTR